MPKITSAGPSNAWDPQVDIQEEASEQLQDVEVVAPVEDEVTPVAEGALAPKTSRKATAFVGKGG